MAQQQSFRKNLLPFCLSACLISACGGGSSGEIQENTPEANTPHSQTQAPTPPQRNWDINQLTADSNWRYAYTVASGIQDLNSFSKHLNAVGSAGYRFISPFYFTGNNVISVSMVSVKDVDEKYEYQIVKAEQDGQKKLELLNEKGASGYQYYGDVAFGLDFYSAFVKNVSNPGKYHYRTVSLSVYPEQFVSKANAQGDDGYKYFGVFFTNLVRQEWLFMTNENAHTKSVYRYKVAKKAPDLASFMAQINEHGEQGYRYKGQDISIGTIFIRDETQNAKFSYISNGVHTMPDEFHQNASLLGSKGYGIMTILHSAEIFVQARDCSGDLCKVLHPVTQN
ncbi:MAG: hypothetical protein Q4D19_10655 [Lautropia sp.]|nr:hypothetical protein [Lautropia sp.]